MKVLVTGGTGTDFVGGHVARELLKQGVPNCRIRFFPNTEPLRDIVGGDKFS